MEFGSKYTLWNNPRYMIFYVDIATSYMHHMLYFSLARKNINVIRLLDETRSLETYITYFITQFYLMTLLYFTKLKSFSCPEKLWRP